MEYDHIPGVSKDISRLVQGTMMLNSEAEENFALLDTIFACGCNTFDAAHGYGGGDCERVLGRWVNERGLREEVVILDKCAHHNMDRKRVTTFDITADLHDSLARLQTDYIDLYLLHRDDPSVPVGPIVEVLNEHCAAGRIHAFGGSNWSTERIAEANDHAARHDLTPFAVSSPHFSLAEQMESPWVDCITITGAANGIQRAWYREELFPLFCWSSLAGGWFSGRISRANQGDHEETRYLRCYGSEENWQCLERADAMAKERDVSVTQIALAYVLHQDFRIFPLVAAYTPRNFAIWRRPWRSHCPPKTARGLTCAEADYDGSEVILAAS